MAVGAVGLAKYRQAVKELAAAEKAAAITTAGFKPASSSGLPLEVTTHPFGDTNSILIRSNYIKMGEKFVPVDGPRGISKHHPQSLGLQVLSGSFNPTNGTLSIHWYSVTGSGNHFGRELVSKAIEHVGPQKVRALIAELGATNKSVFQATRSKGMSAVEAVWQTPLGKTARDLGFKNVTIDEVTLNVRFTFE